MKRKAIYKNIAINENIIALIELVINSLEICASTLRWFVISNVLLVAPAIVPLSNSNYLGFASRCEGRKNPHYLDGLKSYIFTNSIEFNIVWKQGTKLDTSKSKIYHYNSKFKNTFYNMDWGISHSTFTSEPFGYGIFEAVDYGKLPILHSTWCKDFEYPYRASSKKEFNDIYSKLMETPYSEKNKWFKLLKQFMINNYTNKNRWTGDLLNIYNI